MDKLRILVCPLNWGLGHATRMVPLIHCLSQLGAQPVIAANGAASVLLHKEFPQLQHLELAAPNFSYAKHRHQSAMALWQAPAQLLGIAKEHQQLKVIVQEHRIDGVISDNRFGLWHKSIPAVFITHQLFIQTPATWRFMAPVIRNLNFFFARKFDGVWLADLPLPHSIAGKLTHQKQPPFRTNYIGLLSRFSAPKTTSTQKKLLVALVSGPEKQRTLFETCLLNELGQYHGECVLVCGLPQQQQTAKQLGKLTVYAHLESKQLEALLLRADYIICRSGYSTIMDLLTLGKRALLIPTPGQTEQEYLAQQLSQWTCFATVSQKEFSLRKAIAQLTQLKEVPCAHPTDLLKNTLSQFLASVRDCRTMASSR